MGVKIPSTSYRVALAWGQISFRCVDDQIFLVFGSGSEAGGAETANSGDKPVKDGPLSDGILGLEQLAQADGALPRADLSRPFLLGGKFRKIIRRGTGASRIAPWWPEPAFGVPREPGELLAALGKAAIKSEQFDAPGDRHGDVSAGRPSFQEHKFPGALVQQCKFDSTKVGRGRKGNVGGVDARTGVRSSGSNCHSLTKIVQPGSEPGVWALVGGLRT
jgi:hypothetical protein